MDGLGIVPDALEQTAIVQLVQQLSDFRIGIAVFSNATAKQRFNGELQTLCVVH